MLCPSRETRVSLLEGERIEWGGPHWGKAHFTPKQEKKTQTSNEMRPIHLFCDPRLGSRDRAGTSGLQWSLLNTTFNLVDREM